MLNSAISLYLHIPFCRKKCSYCDFNTYAGMEDSFARYVDALCREIAVVGRFYQRPMVKTIFIGGGTPTVLAIAQLQSIMTACQSAFRILPDAEITSEANPGTVDEAYLRELRQIGLNRISFGAQSFHPAELAMLGRLHTADGIGQTIAAARRAGFDNLNLDLIYGLPGQSLTMWKDTLEQAITLQPEHISLYSLTLEDGTSLRAQVARGELPTPDTDLAADMYELTDDLLALDGYTQYEISNWTKPDFECRHNLTYWRNQPYLACGPGAHSSQSNRRWWNVRPVPDYLHRLETLADDAPPHPALDDAETLDTATQMAETMMLGLRLTQEGVDLAAFEVRFGQTVDEAFGVTVAKLKALHLLKEEGQRLKLTSSARLLGNQVFMEFLPD